MSKVKDQKSELTSIVSIDFNNASENIELPVQLELENNYNIIIYMLS